MTSYKLENKSARILQIGTAVVPPTEPGQPSTVLTFADDAEAEDFKKHMATPTVQQWIETGELAIEDAPDPEPPKPQQPPAPPQPTGPTEPGQPGVPMSEPEPEAHAKKRRGGLFRGGDDESER